MNISGLGGSPGNWAISRPQNRPPAPQTVSAGKMPVPQDQLDLSPAAQLMRELVNLDAKASPAERAALIERIRQEIADGTYDTDEKLEKALDKFMQRHLPSDD